MQQSKFISSRRARRWLALCLSLTLRISVCVTSALLPGAAAHASIFGSPMSDWVRTAAQQPVPTLTGAPKAIVLYSDEVYTVGSNGQATSHVREVIKILRPQGRDYGVQSVWFDKDSKILSLHVWSIDAAGHEYVAKDQDILEMSPPGEGGELYEDVKMRVVDPPGRDPGGVIAIEYEKRERPYLAETNWFFQDELPRLHQSFTLVLPIGYEFVASWAHHAAIPPTAQTTENNQQQIRWEIDTMPAIDLERVSLAPSADSLSARLTLHYGGHGQRLESSWAGIGEWYTALAKDRATVTPEIAAKAAELTAGKTDFYDKAQAIGEYVQHHIRYFVIEMGIGGFQPHFAGDIYKGHYGDCKDKATLMVAMLAAVNIQATTVMVDTERGVVALDAPSIHANHMIGAIAVPAGYESPKMHSIATTKSGQRYLIFDPTWEQTPFGQLEDNLQGSYGLLIAGSNSELVQLPLLDPKLNRIERTAHLELAADGSLTGSFRDRRQGDIASTRRAAFLHQDERERQQYVDRIVSGDLTAATVSKLAIDNLNANDQPLTTSFEISARHYADVTGPLLMLRPRILGEDAPTIDHDPRAYDVDLSDTMQIVDHYEIELPEGFAVDELPDPVKLDLGFASYDSAAEVHGHTLEYTRTYTQRQVTLPAAKYADLRQLAKTIGEDEESRVVLKRQATGAGKTTGETR